MTLYLYSTNNYYNRKIVRYNTIEEYNENFSDPVISLTGINYSVSDGIQMEQIFNYNGEIYSDLASGAVSPSYAIYVNEANEIVSRWWVVGSIRTRYGQVKLDLYRDVIADWYDDVLTAPLFVEKALARIGDSAIYNSENMTYNQIKKSEKLLKDKSNSAWIVGYIDSKYEGDSVVISEEGTSIDYDGLDSLADYPYYKYNSSYPLFTSESITNTVFRFNFYNTGATGGDYVIGANRSGDYVRPALDIQENAVVGAYGYYHRDDKTNKGYAVPYGFLSSGGYAMGLVAEELIEPIKRANWTIFSPLDANFGDKYTNTALQTILFENGKVIQAGDKFYRISVNQGDAMSIKARIEDTSSLGAYMKTVVSQSPHVDTNESAIPIFEYEITGTPVYFTFTEIAIDSYSISIPSATNRYHLNDAPYDMFAIPVGDIKISTGDEMIPEVGYKLAAAIQRKLQEKVLYDIQLLPFCPLDDNYFENRTLNVLKLEAGQIYLLTDDNEEAASCMIWLTKSSFTKYISSPISVATNDIEFKVQNECDFYRLSSPNYASSFEFSPTKNNGVKSFRVDCQYKPVSPYIRIAPLFDGLYGPISDDARGLICNGDFSLPQISDSWTQYQQQNKNFQEIFNRQVENMEVNNSVARIQERAAAAAGSLQGAGTGAIAGGMTGGIGGILGGVVGGAASALGGFTDIRLNERLRSEAMDYTIDQFGYQLGNIRALPTTITKVSSFNPNNKIFPVLEYYTSTEIEKEALRNKIKYNGMTIMRIGSVEEFLRETPTYIKGRLIRMEQIPENYYIVKVISDELNKGVFI